MKAKTLISALIVSFTAMGAAHAQAGADEGPAAPGAGRGHVRTTNDDPNNIPFRGVYGQIESGLTREQVLAELRDAPRPGPFDELPLGQGDSGDGGGSGSGDS
ncbi:DUF4148 domain-containing protein [Bordetella sputigena]|uniref:hypothetical protein n=1 Tax=Bordetella sputigena TaxID=1416810 RepID=UPI0039F06033